MSKDKGGDQTLKSAGNLIPTDQKLTGLTIEGIKITTKPYAGWEGDPIVVIANIEFSNATLEDILPDVQKSVIIRWQNRMRKDIDGLVAMNGTTISIDVTEKGQRGDMGPRRAVNLLGRKVKDGTISVDELDELIKELKKEIKK